MPRSPKSPTPPSLSTTDAITARLVVRRVKDARYVCHERETEVLM